MNKVLFIVGPTATGKTSLALQLSKVLSELNISSELISADSRQVFIGMDIGTGKDIPHGFTKHQANGYSFFSNTQTKIWLIDQIYPNQQWSVSQFVQTSSAIIEELHQRNTLAIIVGGTGLYSRSLEHPPKTLHVPQSPELREQLEQLSTIELQKKLQQTDYEKFQSMNHSDQNNPRRLIRAMEVASQYSVKDSEKVSTYDTLWIGLQAPLTILEKKIKQRVQERIELGMLEEVTSLMKQYPSWEYPSFTSSGYKEIRSYLENPTINSLESAQQKWTLHEFQYAKRQLTWFKKQKSIHWFDITTPNIDKDIENIVKTWYYTPNDNT